MKNIPLGIALLTNYAKMAWRSLIKNKFTSLVSIAGLVTGLTGSFFIGLFILDELAYDKHFKNREQVYRITSTYHKDGHIFASAMTRGDIGPVSVLGVPEIQAATRLMPADEAFLFTEKSAFKEKIIFTDAAFLTVFGFDLLRGSKRKCLANPSSVIISERTAFKLFGSNWLQKEVLGETLSLDGRIPLTVTGVFKSFPERTHFRSDLFASVPTGVGSWMDQHSQVYTYVLLHRQADENNVNSKFRDLSAHLFHDEKGAITTLGLQPLSEIYLFSSLENENALQGNIKNIYALVLITIFLIAITVVNFVNLYTAGSFTRLKEVGVRKTMGAFPRQLQLQFFGETVLITLVSVGIAFLLTTILLPTFNQLTGKQLLTSSLYDDKALILISCLTLIIALLAGSYPALNLSGRKTTEALKGLRKNATGAVEFRKGLIVLQFSLSCIMIILSIVAFQQVNLISKKDLGFDRAHTLAIANPYMLGSKASVLAFRQQLLKVPGVEDISITGYTPSQNRWGRDRITFPERNELSLHRQHANWIIVDENFINTMGIRLIEGRNFLENHEHDKDAVIINQTAAAQFKLNTDGKSPLGRELSYHEEGDENPKHFKVVGVVADFNFGSLHEEIKPVIMKAGHHRFEMAMRISSRYPALETLKEIESVWKKSLPLIPFEYSFIQNRFDQLHKSDITASKLFSIFCLLTIIMSALGLFSMVTYSVVNRTKELGVRKLLGASGTNITILVAGDFLKLILIAYVLALPFAWFMARRWIDNFAYKIEIDWWIFPITGLILLVVCLLTLSWQTWKAALTNPVENLRHE